MKFKLFLDDLGGKAPIWVILFLVNVGGLLAQNERLVVVNVDTFKVFDENVSLKEAKLQTLNFARLEAIRRAVPAEVVDISMITDKQAQIGKKYEEETIHSIFTFATRNGMIVDEKILKEAPEFRNHALYYYIKLQAKVQTVQGKRNPSLDIKLSVNNANLRDGEKLEITVQPTKDGYLYLFDFLSDNTVQLLFPNAYSKNNFLKADQVFTLPSSQEKEQGIFYKVVARKDAKVTNEMIYAVFTLQPITGIEEFEQIKKGYVSWSGGEESFIKFQRWLLKIPLDQRVEREMPIHIIR